LFSDASGRNWLGARPDACGRDYDIPPDERGEVNDFAFSPDSKEDLLHRGAGQDWKPISTKWRAFSLVADGGPVSRKRLRDRTRDLTGILRIRRTDSTLRITRN